MALRLLGVTLFAVGIAAAALPIMFMWAGLEMMEASDADI